MKRMNLMLVTLLAVAIPLLAFAAPAVTIDSVARWVKGGLYVGTAGSAAQHRITQSLGARVSLDFSTAFDGGCQDLTTPLAGAQYSDACHVGAGTLLSDAGVSLPPAGDVFSCFVSAPGVVTVRGCPQPAAPPPMHFQVRVLSSQ